MTFVVKCAPVLTEWRFCCCSCSLRAASVVISWFCLITSIMQFVTCVIILCHPMFVYQPYAVSAVSTEIGSLILSSLLVLGVHNKKPIYMLPFLVMDLIGLVMVAAFVVIGCIIFIPKDWIIGFLIFFVGSALLALCSFLWVVLYSYYRQIEEEKNATSNAGIVNYTYGIPTGQVQITNCPEDEKALYPYSKKVEAEVA